jgi:hypothetical protein
MEIVLVIGAILVAWLVFTWLFNWTVGSLWMAEKVMTMRPK